MYSKICELIQQNDNWEEILNSYKIKVSHEDNYILCKYSMDADFFNPIVKEARGIIIDLNYNIPVCFPFIKFGNYGEPYADNIDWTSARVQEKLDGSLIKLWYDGDRWRISSNGMINAFDCKNSEGFNLGTMSLLALMEQQPDLFSDDTKLNINYTYMFELISPDNQIVVQYPKTMIYHIGSRNIVTGKEEEIDLGIIKPKEYKLSSLQECIDFANTFKGNEHEGFVVVDKNYNRIKVKADDYLRLHYMAGNGILTIQNAIQIINENEIDEYCTYFPHKRERLEAMKEQMQKEYASIQESIMTAYEMKISRKDYAIKYHSTPHFSFVMSVLYDRKVLQVPNKYWINYFKEETKNNEEYVY